MTTTKLPRTVSRVTVNAILDGPEADPALQAGSQVVLFNRVGFSGEHSFFLLPEAEGKREARYAPLDAGRPLPEYYREVSLKVILANFFRGEEQE